MYYIGLDLGGTNIAAGVVSGDGRVLIKKSVPTFRERAADDIIKDMAGLCLDIIKDYGVSPESVASIGIGSPGSVDPKNGVILYANNLNFKDVEIRKKMSAYTPIPVYLDNDANCAALGENTSGAAKGAANSVTVTLGTGVGSGIIIGGKIFSGSFHGGAELGHHTIKVGGEQCTCGRLGCWETYASATALIRKTQNALINSPESEISKITGGDVSLVTAKTPFDAAEAGDKIAISIIDEYLKDIAEGIVNIINIFQPEKVVIGGGVCQQGERIRKPISDYVDKRVYGGNNKTELIIAELGNDAGIVGAAMLSKPFLKA